MVLLLNKGMNLSSDCPEVVKLKWHLNEAQNHAVGSSLTPSSVGPRLLKGIPNIRPCSTFSSTTRTLSSIGICFQAPGDTCFHFDKTAKSSRSLVCPWISARLLRCFHFHTPQLVLASLPLSPNRHHLNETLSLACSGRWFLGSWPMVPGHDLSNHKWPFPARWPLKTLASLSACQHVLVIQQNVPAVWISLWPLWQGGDPCPLLWALLVTPYDHSPPCFLP